MHGRTYRTISQKIRLEYITRDKAEFRQHLHARHIINPALTGLLSRTPLSGGGADLTPPNYLENGWTDFKNSKSSG